MKTNGLRNKKPQCARTANRITSNGNQAYSLPKVFAVLRWHRATWRKL